MLPYVKRLRRGNLIILCGVLLVLVAFIMTQLDLTSTKHEDEGVNTPTPSVTAVPTRFVTVAKDGSGDFRDIQRAIDAEQSNGSIIKVVYVKNGVYDVSQLIVRSDLVLRGESRDGVIIQTDGTRRDVITSAGDVSNLLIESLTIEQNAVPDNKGSSALYLREGSHSNITLRNLRVQNVYGAGIAVPRFRDLVIENCTLENCWTGIAVNGGDGALIRFNNVTFCRGDAIFTQSFNGFSVNNCIIERNVVRYAGDTGIDVSSSNSGPPHSNILVKDNALIDSSMRVTHAVNVTLLDNVVEGSGGLTIDSGQGTPYNVLVEGGSWTLDGRNGIVVRGGSGVTIRDVNLTMRGDVEGQTGIVAAIFDYGLIENVNIVNSSMYGIDFAGWQLGFRGNLLIKDCVIKDFGDTGIYDSSKWQGRVTIEGCHIVDSKGLALYGIRTGDTRNHWVIRDTVVEAGTITKISSPGSTVS